jgi:hypothetical protein
MFSSLRAGGIAAAFVTLAAMFAAPAMAADAPVVPVAARTLSILTLPRIAAAPALQPLLSPPGPNGAAAPAVAVQPIAPAVAMSQGRPLRDLVIAFVDYGKQDAEEECLAKAVYFEARGESLEGQLAVAQVVLNRAASGIYPATICDVVTQPAQFSFIRGGKFPPIDASSACWHKALAIADIARKDLAQEIAANVLWYHASYVSPAWGHRLTRVAQIGTHIFYS